MVSESKPQIASRRSLRDKVYDHLRQRIITGALPPGGEIDDKEIAAELGISRTPVREAVKKLSDEHLVDVIAQSSTRVSLIDLHELRQAYIIRRALEMESAAHAALNISQRHVEALEEIVALQAQAVSQKKFADAIGFDDSFHRYIALVSNLHRLWGTIEISKAELDRCRHKLIPLTGEAQATLNQHRDVIAALRTGKSEAARDAMGLHLDLSYRNTVRMLEAEEAEANAKTKTQRHQ
jgi:DNA-binding GntR family transcriptional regulator